MLPRRRRSAMTGCCLELLGAAHTSPMLPHNGLHSLSHPPTRLPLAHCLQVHDPSLSYSPRTTSLTVQRRGAQRDSAEETFFRKLEAEVCRFACSGLEGSIVLMFCCCSAFNQRRQSWRAYRRPPLLLLLAAALCSCCCRCRITYQATNQIT